MGELFKDIINFNPDKEKTSEKSRAWQGCPTIASTKGGRLFAGWYTGGIIEPDPRNYNILVMSDDGGESWSDPVMTIGTDYKNDTRAIDIQLWTDNFNRLWVCWVESEYRQGLRDVKYTDSFNGEYLMDNYFENHLFGVWTVICENPDANVLTWTKPKRFSDGFLRCKPIILSDGRYIMPAYDWNNEKEYMLRFSDDNGKTFYDVKAAEKPENGAFDETVVTKMKDGSLMLLARTNKGYYAKSVSRDGGKTWSKTEEFEKAPSSRLYFGHLSDGSLIYVRNVDNKYRNGMKACISEDEGKTWHSLVIDERENVSYPDVCECDGYIYIVHDCERDNRCHGDKEKGISTAAKEILISKLTKNDIISGKPGEGSYISKVLSKGLDNSFIV